jgi:hypothetical protein
MADTPPEPPPVKVVLPGLGGQEVTGRLHERQQTSEGWLFRVSVPAWQNTAEGGVEPAWYMVWVKAPEHVRRIAGVSYDDVPTTRLPPSPIEREILGPRRPTGWVLQTLDGRRGPDRGVLHAPDCDEAPPGAPVLKGRADPGRCREGGRTAVLAVRRRPGAGAAAARLRPRFRTGRLTYAVVSRWRGPTRASSRKSAGLQRAPRASATATTGTGRNRASSRISGSE